MKERNSYSNREIKPSKNRPERPDNNLKALKEQGPSSGAWKHNPHWHQSLIEHAWAAN